MAPEAAPLRVLMILESGYPVRGGGGAESQLRTLACELRRRGQRVTIVTPRVANAPQARVERVEGIPVVRLPSPRVRGLARLVLWCRFIAFLQRRGRRYHAWHAHIAHWLAAIACAMGDRLDRPVLVKVSGWWELERGVLAPDAGLLARKARDALRGACWTQAISRRIAAELARHDFPAARVVALPNAVDTRRFMHARREASDEAPLQAIFVGRLVAEKGLSTLFEAIAAAFGNSRHLQLRVVGNGPLEAALRAQAAALGIADAVEFLGHREDIDALLAGADLGLLPSTIEGLSNTLLECMASGLPVVASRISGSEDLVVPGRNGWLFEAGDAGALAACLREAAALPRAGLRALGAQARADVSAHAGLDVVVERLLALYRGAPAHDVAAAPSTSRS